LGQNRLIKDVSRERVAGEILEREPMASQLVKASHQTHRQRAADLSRRLLERSGKDLRSFVRVFAGERPERGGLRSHTLLSSHRPAPSRRGVSLPLILA